MSGDLDIHSAIRDGERNQEAKQLIYNWCRHARVEKFGGTGLIEMETGLPIGPHAMVCDFAPAGGMATYLLEESAVHFHDANCVRCTYRLPVGLPNLSQLVARRDDERRQEQVRRERAQQAKESAYQARAAVRTALRPLLPVAAKAFMDDLDRLDAKRDDAARTRVLESARLAPEILVPDLVAYLFDALEGDERWLDQVALTLLADTPDQARLCRAAMRCLTFGYALEMAATTVAPRVEHVDSAAVADAVIGLAYVAAPPRSEFDRGNDRDGDPGPLLRVAEQFPEGTDRGLRALLTRRDRLRVGVAARAMGKLIAQDHAWVDGFLRPLAATLSRADVAIDLERESELRFIVHDLRQAVAEAFLAFPERTDAELMRQFESASKDGEGRLAGVYEQVLRRAASDRYDSSPLIHTPEQILAFTVAVTRLATLAGTSENSEVTQQVLSALRRRDEALSAIAIASMDLWLGTAAVLDSKLEAPEPEPSILTPPHPLAGMERANRRSSLYHLRAALIESAVHGALTGPEGLSRFEQFLSQRSVLGESFEAAIIRKIAPLLETSAGLQAVLPYLYRAMVGASVLGRAAGAGALKDISYRRADELPELVFESLFLMLLDPYVIVHKAAVGALGRIRLPERFHRLQERALDQLIMVYRGGKDPEFLLQCIEARVRMHRSDAPLPNALGSVLLALMAELDHSHLLGNARYVLRQMKHIAGWASLVLSLVARAREDYELEHALELLAELPAGEAAAHVPAILEAVTSDPQDTRLCTTFVELLTRDRAWAAATQVGQLHVAAFADTRRERGRKLHALQLQWRTDYEFLLSERRVPEALAIGHAWAAANDELADIQKQHEQADPFRFLSRPPADD